MGLKVAFVVLAAAGVATLWMAVLADTGASALVVANAVGCGGSVKARPRLRRPSWRAGFGPRLLVEEVRVHEVVDRRLVDRLDRREGSPIPAFGRSSRPRFEIDVLLRSGQRKRELHVAVSRSSGLVVRIADTAAVEVQRQRGRNRPAGRDRRSGMPITTRGLPRRLNCPGNRCGAMRRQDVLDGAVFVDVPADAERRQLAHFLDAAARCR